MWFVYHKIQVVTVFRVVTEAHAGPALHLLLAPAKTGMCQPRRKETALEKACLCKKNGLCFLVFLHSTIQLTPLVHRKKQLCCFLGAFPNTLAAILCSVFVPSFWTDDVTPWTSPDTTLATLSDGTLNHMVLCSSGIKRPHKTHTNALQLAQVDQSHIRGGNKGNVPGRKV